MCETMGNFRRDGIYFKKRYKLKFLQRKIYQKRIHTMDLSAYTDEKD